MCVCYMNEALNSVNFSGLKEHVGPHDIVLGELEGVSERVIHVSLSCKVHNRVYAMLRQHIIYPDQNRRDVW